MNIFGVYLNFCWYQKVYRSFNLMFQFNAFSIEQLIKRRAKVKSSVHLNTLLQRMRGILKANNELYFYMLITKKN